ncbi:MAG: glycosyltransferase family 4 protein [Poseidonibacter sp.]|uniref:glycosyltransferase family 4 protein n=1 Tax=Poseidonibacter sp. TaxID=2321188 RepID=UPI00359D8C6C
MDKQIIIISEYFYPNERTDAFLLTEISKRLATTNKNVKIVCTSQLNGNTELSSLEDKVIRLKESRLNSNNLIMRILKFLNLTTKLSLKAFSLIKKHDRVLITTNPAFLLPIISLFRKFINFEYTILVYDVFPENLVSANIISKKNFFYKIIKKIFDWSYSQSDRLIVIGRDMQDVMSQKISTKTRIFLIQNWCNYENISYEAKNKNKILLKLGIETKKVFLFAGNLGRVQGITTLLEASNLVKNKDFILLFIGEGACKNEIISFIDSNKNGKVVYGGSYPLSEQNDFLNACDVSIISLNKSMYGLGVPSKSYTNMAAQKPLLYIGDEQSEIAQVINEFNIGWSVEPGDKNKLASKIDEICMKSDLYKEIGKRSRDVVVNYFSKDLILNKYSKLFEENI